MRLNDEMRQGAILLVANGLLVACTFALNLLLARRLGPEGYGEWSALWALILVSSALFPSLVLLCARYVAAFVGAGEPGRARAFGRRVGALTLVGGMLLFTAMFYVRGSLEEFFQLTGVTPVALVAAFLGVSFFLSFVRGVIEGLQDFPGLGANIAVEGALRLMIGIVLILLDFGMVGLLIAYLVAALIPTFTGALRLAGGELDLLGRTRSERLPEGFVAEAALFAWPVLASHLLVVVWTNLDLLLVKHFTDEINAGLYGVLFTAGKVAFFVAEALASVMIPKIAAAHAAGGDEGTPLRRTGTIVAAFCLGMIVIGLVAPKALIVGLFGESFAAAAPLLGIYLIAASCMALAVFAVKAHLARGETGFLLMLTVGIAGVALVVWLFGGNVTYVVWSLLVFNALILVAVAKSLWPLLRGDRS